MQSFSQIIGRVKTVKGLKSDKSVAELLGMNRTALASHKSRDTVPLVALLKLCVDEGISFDWLLTGEGEVYRRTLPVGGKLESDTIRPLARPGAPGVAAPPGAEYDAEYNNLINSGQMREIIGILLIYNDKKRETFLKHLLDIMKILA